MHVQEHEIIVGSMHVQEHEIIVSSSYLNSGKIYDGWIRYLEFNHYYTKNQLISWSNCKELYYQKQTS